jgi:hypothetical protein
MVISFQEEAEERSAAGDWDSDEIPELELREESFEDDDPAPFEEDYASDNAGDPDDYLTRESVCGVVL